MEKASEGNLRSLLRTVLVRSGAVELALPFTRNRLRILMYHGVSPRSVPFELLDAQLRYVQARFDAYWASEIPELLPRLAELPRPAVILTFDDGLRTASTRAAPLLARYGLKATFYLVSGLLERGGMLWNHELRCRLTLLPDGEMPTGIPRLPADTEVRWSRAGVVVEEVKRWENGRREELLRELRERLAEPDYPAWMLEETALMTAAEARSLPDCVEIGSHSQTHAILDRLPPEAAQREIRDSRVELEAITKRPVRTFCYPNGAYAPEQLEFVRSAYEVAVTTDKGFVYPGDSPLELRRLPAGRSFETFVMSFVRRPT